MSGKEAHLLDPNLLPESLWVKGLKTLHLPPALSEVYLELIDSHDLRELAEARDPKNPPVGGLDQERTDKHFAQAFDGSVARVQLAVTDPKRQVMRAANAFMQTLSGNQICITDAPCGAGAASFAFLTTISELRAHDVLPRQPLNVRLICAEISQPARDYAEEILEKIRPGLEEQAIFVEPTFLHWDVTDTISNSDLIRRMTLATADNRKLLLVIANFSGFLKRTEKLKKALPKIEELFRYASGPNTNNIAIWIEPQMNVAVAEGGLFAVLKNWVANNWHRYVQINLGGEGARSYLQSECQFQSPLNPSQTHFVRLAVMRLDFVRS